MVGETWMRCWKKRIWGMGVDGMAEVQMVLTGLDAGIRCSVLRGSDF